MFLEVDAKDLVVGEKYTILSSFDVGIYITATFDCHRRGQRFHSPKEHSGIKNKDTYNRLLTIQNKNNDPSYYTFVPQKEKIQQAMEKRALDKILKQLVNDNFTW